MFSAPCQGCQSLHELGKKLICAEKELFNSPGVAAENRQPQCRCKALLLPISLGKFIFGGAGGYAHACSGQWIVKQAASRSAVSNRDCTELESSCPTEAEAAELQLMVEMRGICPICQQSDFSQARNVDFKRYLWACKCWQLPTERKQNNDMDQRKV